MIRKSIVLTNFKDYGVFLLCFTFLFAGTILNVNNARSQTVVTTISIGPEAGSGFAPSQIAVNSATNRIYVSNSISESISVIDGETGNVVDNFKVGQMGGMDINSVTNKVYVVTLSGLQVIDGETNDSTTISVVGRLGWPVGVNSTTNLIYIYVVNRDRGNISVIDGETNKIVDTIAFREDVTPVRISVNSFTNRIYVVCEDGNIMVINGETNRTIDIVDIGGRLSIIAANTTTNRIYVLSDPPKNENSIIEVINGETNRVIDKIELEGLVRGIGINPGTNSIYVTFGEERAFGTVKVIDGESHQVVNVITTVGSSPEGVAVNHITNAVYVANAQEDSLSVIDGESNMHIDTIQIGESLYGGIGINYETNRVYVGSWSSKAIIVIDGDTNKVIDAVRVAISAIGVPVGVGVNSATNLIYVAIANDGIVAVIDGVTNEVVTNIRHPAFIENGGEIGVNSLTNRIYVTSSQGVSVIDGNTNSIIDFIRVFNSASEIVVNSETNLIYVIRPTNSVKVIDGETNKVIDNIRIHRIMNIEGLAVNPVTNRIYVGSFTAVFAALLQQDADSKLPQGRIARNQSTGICVINGKTNKVMECLTSPISTVIGVNPTTNRIYTASHDEINVVDGEKNLVIATVKVESGPKQAIGINPLSNLIYITNPRSGNLTVIMDDIQP